MKKKLLVLAVLVFTLNLLWEVSHSLLYDWNALPLQNSVYFYAPKILYSTFWDLVLIAIIFILISLINKKTTWVNKPSKLDYFIIVF